MNAKQRKHFIDLIKRNGLICEAKKRYVTDITDFDKIFVTIDDLIQGIREDLDVVEGNIKEFVSKFVSMPIDKYLMKRNPNLID